MSLLFRKLASYAVRKVATDPKARQQAADVAQKAAKEVQQIARADNRAFEAGRSVRRALNRLNKD